MGAKGSTNKSFESGEFHATYIPKFTTLEKFVDAKIEMLNEQMCMDLTENDISRLRNCKTDVAVDNMVRLIIKEHWD